MDPRGAYPTQVEPFTGKARCWERSCERPAAVRIKGRYSRPRQEQEPGGLPLCSPCGSEWLATYIRLALEMEET